MFIEKYVDYKSKPGRISKEYKVAVQKGVKSFVDRNRWDENISKNESRNSGCDIEATYLLHGIWHKLMMNGSIIGRNNSFLWKTNIIETESTMLFHLDIMNNPKKEGQNKGCGLRFNCDINKIESWKNIYHSVGNTAPIPWFEIYGNRYIDGQCLHKSFDERWDLFLQQLKWMWKSYSKRDMNNNEILSFEDYMILTCQQMYFEDVYNDVMNCIDSGNILLLENWENKEIRDNQIVVWKKKILEWNEMIKPDSELISFERVQNESANDKVEKIIKLIKIRCVVIGVLLHDVMQV